MKFRAKKRSRSKRKSKKKYREKEHAVRSMRKKIETLLISEN